MGKQTRADLQLLRDQLQQRERHRLLNGLMGAVGQELQRELQLELPPPTGRQENARELKLRLVLVEQLDQRQRQRLQGVLQRCSDPRGLLQMLDRSGFFDQGAQ